MKNLLLAVFVLASSLVSAQLKINPLIISKLDTIYLGITNKFAVNPSIIVQNYDKQKGKVFIEDGRLIVYPARHGDLSVQLYWKDSSMTIQKSFYAIALPKPQTP